MSCPAVCSLVKKVRVHVPTRHCDREAADPARKKTFPGTLFAWLGIRGHLPFSRA